MTYREANEWAHVLSTLAYVVVKTPEGDLGTGTAFHIGSGYFVTARHVIANNEIVKVGQNDLSLRTSINPDGSPNWRTTHPGFEQAGFHIKRFEHPDGNVDVEIIQLTGVLSERGPALTLQPVMQLTDHANILTEGELLMIEVKVFGYPPIPYAINAKPALIASSGEISGVITNRVDGHRHFIVSGLARAGFSGGPVVLVGNPRVQASANNIRDNSVTVIGVIGKSLESRSKTAKSIEKPVRPAPEITIEQPSFEPGYLDATSIETVRDIIKHHNLPLQV